MTASPGRMPVRHCSSPVDRTGGVRSGSTASTSAGATGRTFFVPPGVRPPLAQPLDSRQPAVDRRRNQLFSNGPPEGPLDAVDRNVEQAPRPAPHSGAAAASTGGAEVAGAAVARRRASGSVPCRWEWPHGRMSIRCRTTFSDLGPKSAARVWRYSFRTGCCAARMRSIGVVGSQFVR